MNRGYDAPLSSPESDFLDAMPLARAVLHAATDVPNEWSARIGVYGAWGSGKTTVLNFVQALATDVGRPVVRFNAWDYQSAGVMFGALLVELKAQIPGVSAELADRGLGAQLKTWLPKVRRAWAWGGRALGKSGFADASLEAADTLVGVDADFLRSVVERGCAGLRVLVLIDDLDRAHPDVVPEVLFTVRELLDLPGFSFVLAFDPERVSGALAERSEGLRGGEYLEKIVDFPFRIPAATHSQLLRLTLADAQEYAPSFDSTAIRASASILPRTPRGCRAVVRQLRAVQLELRRRNPDELSHIDLLRIILIRQQWPSFATQVFSDPDELRSLFTAALSDASSSARRHDEKSDKLGERVAELTRDVSTSDRKRLLSTLRPLLFSGISANEATWSEHAWLMERPVLVTRREYDGLREVPPGELKEAIAEDARCKRVTPADLAEAAALHGEAEKGELLAAVRQAFTPEERAECEERAIAVVSLQRQLLAALQHGISPDIGFGIINATAARSGHAEVPSFLDADASLAAFVLDTIEAPIGGKCREIVRARRRVAVDSNSPWAHQVLDREAQLHTALAATILEGLRARSGLDAIVEEVGADLFPYIVCPANFPLWAEDQIVSLGALADAAASDRTIHRNLLSLFYLLYRGIEVAPVELPGSALAQPDVIRALWRGMTARPVEKQFGDSLSEISPVIAALLGTPDAPCEWLDVPRAASS